jgi:hypothetical protein
MTDNIYDQDEMKDLAAAQPAAISHAQPDNFFGDTIGEMPANPGANETIVPKTTPGRTWKDMLHDGISIDNARESARQRTLAEKANPRMETQQEAQEASFAGAFQHGVGIQNITAIANVMDHFADSYGDQWWSRKAQSLRDSIKDGSGYKPIYESYKQIGGLKDFFGYTKEKLGENLGMMLPSMLGATALGSIGATQGELVGGKFGAKVGGVAGGLVGAAAGNAHLQWSEMREALKREGLEGQDLVRYTDMGGAILVGLDSLFPSFAAMKLGGFARNAIAGKVAGKLVENLRQGGKMRTASEFIKQFGKSLAADAVLETTTELAQQYVTDLKAKEFAGKEITAGDVEKFAKETAPEIIIATLVSTIGLSIPGSAAKSYRDIRDAKADAVVPGAKPATATETAEEEGAPSPAAMDGTPAAEAALGSQPVMEDPSRDPTPNPAAGAAGNGVLQFIRAQGGLLPDGEFAALSADRIPGLVSENGKSLTEMRDALVEAGYLEESGPDQPDLASHDDVYDLVQRAMSGERIVPLADRQADEDFQASLDSKDAHKQLAWAEDSIVLPAIEQYNEETGDPTLGQVYRKLRPDDRIAVIERVRDGEDVVNVVEEIIAANVDTEAVQAMVAVYGPNPELIERVRALLAEQQPDLLHGFDEMLAQFPTRRARVPREPARRPGDQPTELVRGMGGRLKAIAGDAQAFEIAIGEMERDRKILKDDAFRIATDFLGKAPKKGTKASYFQAIRAGQIQARSPNNRSIFMREGEGALRTQMTALSEKELADIIERRSMARPKKGMAKEAMVEWLVKDAREAHENRVAAAGGGGNSYQRAVEAVAQKEVVGGQQTLLGGEGRDILPNEPAVPVSKSVTPAAIVSLIDGSRHADLRTHLKKQGIDVEDYARNFRLADNYPLVAANVVAEKHNATRQTETYETFAKRFTVGAEKLAGVEAVQKAIQSASPQALDAALPKLNKRRLAEMAAKLGVKDKNPIKEIGRRFTHDLREAAKFPHIGEIGLGSPDPAADQARGEQMRNKALAEFAAAADPSVAVPTAEPTATPAAPRDLLMELIQLANSKTPRDQWGAILGVSPKELRTAEKAAIEAGILAYDKRGVARRSPEGQKLSAEGIVAEFNALLDEKMPTTRNAQGVDVPAKKAVENWHNRVKAVIAQVGALPLADAQRIAAALAGRKVNKSEMTSRPKIVSLITDRIDNIADSRIKSAVLSGSAAMIAPGTLAGENVMLTPKAESKVEALQRIVDDAVAGILPAHIRVDVVDNIEIGRLAREDELFALRSSGSDIITEPEEMDDGSVVEGSAAAGRKGRASAPSGAASGTSARLSEGAAAARRRGDARLEAAGVQRIVRQESASLRSDGSVFAGRPTKGARTPAGRDAASAQRAGQTLSFKIDGFKGRVIAEELETYDADQGNMGRLNYRVFDSATKDVGENAAPLAEMHLVQHPDGAWEIENVEVNKSARGTGVGRAFYEAVEADLGIRMSPSGFLSPQGYAFWKKRSPESVKWHVQSPTFAAEDGAYYFSPRKIKDELARIGTELRNVSQGIGRSARLPPEVRAEVIDGLRAERRMLIPLWGKLPVEARAETPNMFSLSDDENLNSASARALGQTDPRAEAISISAKAAEAEARRSGRSIAEVVTTAARHEILELFNGIGLIAAPEWANLQRVARRENWIEETGVRKPYTAHYGKSMGKNQLEDLLLKEAIMEKYGRYRAGDYQPESWLGKIFKRITDFVDRIVNGLRKEGFETWEDIFQKVDKGALRRRYEEIYGRTEQVNTQAMIRAGVLPDVRGIAQAPGATRAPRPSNAPQTVIQRALGRARPIRALSELMADFQRAAGLSVRTGRIDPALQRAATAAGGQANGMYNGVARVRVQRDFDTFAHEAGHHLERTLGGQLRASMAAHSHELLPMASPVAGAGNTSLSEGFAEFFRRYLTNEQAARAQAPGFYRAFENLVEAENPRVYWTMQDIQDEYDRFLMGDPLDRGAAQQTVIRRAPGAVGRFFADAERDGFVSTMADRLYGLHHGAVQAIFDRHHGWWMATRALLEEVNRVTGQRITLAAVDNPNKLIRMTSHTRAWASEDLRNGIALRGSPNGGGVSMHQVMATAFGGTSRDQWNERRFRDFGDYLISRRAVHQYVRFRPQARQAIQAFVAANPQLSFLLPRLPTNIVSEIDRPPTAEPLYEHLNRLLRHEQQDPQFRQAAELYYRFNKDMIELLFEKGLITREEKLEYQQDRDYAPFQRNMSDRETVEGDGVATKRPGRGRDTINKRAVYSAFGGSMRDIISPIQSTVQTLFEIRLRAAVNDTLAAMDRLARQAGQVGNEIFERLPPTQARATQVNIREQLRQAGRTAGMSPTDIAMMLTNVEGQIGQNVVTTMFTQTQASEKGEKIVWFFENGKPIPAQLPDGTLGRVMFESLTAVGRQNAGILMDALTWAAGTVRTGTVFSPSFALRNIWNDMISAPVNSPYAVPLVTHYQGLREIRKGGAYRHLYNRYAGMMGGAATQAFDPQTVERDIQLLRDRGFKIQRPKSWKELLVAITQFGETFETAGRVGIFRAAMKSSIKDGMSEFDAAVEAAHYAHDVMDFSQHGSKTTFIKRIIAFFNASLVGLHRYGKSLTASNDYGNFIQIWNRHSQGLPLSRNEQQALGQAAKAWTYSTLVFGGMSLICYLLGADDDDMKEVPDSVRATHWRISVNGILYLLPKNISTFLAGEDGKTDWGIRAPKPYEMGWFANGVERLLDYYVDNDPTALNGFGKDMFEILTPPTSVAGLDLYYGLTLGKDPYSGKDIIPTFEKGPQEKEREEQFGPYTTWAARQIGDALGVSPYYADFVIRTLFSSSGREATMIAQGIAGEITDEGTGPKLDIGDYPIAQRFTYNPGRSSKSLGKFYDMTTQDEGLSKWFWGRFTEDARSFHSAANTYKDMIKAGGENSVIASEFLSRINPDQRAFAILSADFEGRGKSKYRNLHPMLNAAEGVRVTNNIMKEVVSGTLIQDKDKKFEEKKPLDREQMRFARNELGHIRKGLAQNALQIMGVDGWRDQKMADVDARFKVLKEGAPEVYDELMRRLKKEKVQDGAHLAKVWPKVKERIEASRKDADLGDLYGPIVGE